MAVYSIKDLENLTGIKAHTIRIWEKRYQIVTPKRTDTNIRVYCDNDLKKLLNISILNKNGIKISRIAELPEEKLGDKVTQLTRHNNTEYSQIEGLLVSMIQLDEKQFDKILSKAINKLGFETVFMNILHPLFNRIGILWQTNSITAAQEHFISNLVRQKLIVAIDGLYTVENASSKKFILFLKEGEMHEIGLLFAYFMIKKFGHKVTYLGQSVPFNDLKEVVDITQPGYFFTSFINPLPTKDLQGYLQALYKAFPNKVFLITGSQVIENKIELPKNFTIFKKYPGLNIFLKKL